MPKLVECVPNFSEGRDRRVVDAIADAVRQTRGCTLLDVDPGASTNRTVYTFVGEPSAVVEGALAAARVARERIDMRRHAGEHPRLGALDVCPFVPVADVSMDECAGCAREFGRRLAAELQVPVYLYERAATHAHRQSLKQIRAGEYEGLEEKIRRPEWKPDFGPAAFVPTWGATVTGARDFLIAYNVNVLGTKEQAHRIALDLREQGRGPDQPGRLKAVKAIGWHVDEYGLAQVSMNLDDYKVTPPHVAYEAVVDEARRLKLGVAGSELVGLIPLQAVLMAAEHYIEKEGLFILDERQKVRLAVERLGLSSIAPFVPEKRVIEYMIGDASREPLASMSVRGFVELLGARTPAPGGGSAAALVAAMGAALGAMVGWMTYGKRKFEDKDALMRRLIPPLHRAMKDLLPMIDADTAAFNDYLAATGLPREDDAQKAARAAAMQAGLRKAIGVPLATMRAADACWDALVEMATHGNFASRSDLEVGARCLEVGLWGAFRNVLVNLGPIEDAAFRQQAQAEAEALATRARERCAAVLAALEARSG
ncbi:MAG TPA: glutamate formimidoyltransferase [Vicinamibacteria bacterium]|nr:glutamate formimidoyltransferase [Vicinamibacteria bacterium]